METKNIIYKNFNNKKKLLNKKKLSDFFDLKILIYKYPLLKSFTNNYNYSFKKKDLQNFKKFNDFNLIGMGGSILGTEAIYDFLNHKIKKNSLSLAIYRILKLSEQKKKV